MSLRVPTQRHPGIRLLAVLTLLPLLAATAGLQTLCVCGGCARSDALLGASEELSDGHESPCCRRARVERDAERQRDVERHGGLDPQDCCGDHAAFGAPAATADASGGWVLGGDLVATHALPAAQWLLPRGRATARPAMARAPPSSSGPPLFLRTARVRC